MSSDVFLAYDYPILGAFWTMFLIFVWVMWFMLLFRVIVDIFRDDTMSGWGKTGWTFLVIVLPFLGVFVYLIARGADMGKREQEHARAQQQSIDSYIRETAGTTSHADELAKLADLKNHGDITESEYQHAKEKVLAA